MTISREKKALVVLAAMLLLITSFVMAYVFVGHSLNAAVTTIDEAVGSLEGYTVLLFEGTQSPAVLQPDDSDEEGVMGSSLRREELETILNAEEAPSSAQVQEAGQKKGQDSQEPSFAGLEEGDLSGVYRENQDDLEAGLTPLESLEKSYQAKGASTLRLDLAHAQKYRDGMILQVGSKRIGVMSATKEKTTSRSLKRLVRYFHKHGVKCIVCISNSKKLLKDVVGITIAVLTYPAASPATSVSGLRGTSYVLPPVRGAAGAAIIGPGYVVSVRTQLPFQQEDEEDGR